jgi:phytanoyl-CoA hydroxylase
VNVGSEQLEFWNENGYLVVENMFSPSEVESLRESAGRLSARADGLTESTDRFILHTFGANGEARPVVQQIAEPHELGGEWMALARDTRILDTVELLIGPNIQLYYSMMMMKPPRQGSRAPWHQDFAFFVHDRARLVACQVYLDDSTLENGCVRVVPGSHKAGLLNHFDGDDFTEQVQGDTSAFDTQEVALPVRAGGAAFWHCMTLHSSHPNTSERPRRAVVFEYKDAGTRLLKGSFSAGEVRSAGMMLRGRDPRSELLSAL